MKITVDELKALLRANSQLARFDDPDTGYITVGYVIEKLDQLDVAKAERKLAEHRKWLLKTQADFPNNPYHPDYANAIEHSLNNLNAQENGNG